MENGIITKDDVICPVDESGRFTEEVTDFAGQYVKVRPGNHLVLTCRVASFHNYNLHLSHRAKQYVSVY